MTIEAPMRHKQLSKLSRNPSDSLISFPAIAVLRQAWNLFVFSSFFAVLFNAFYVDGIDLKFKPKIYKQFVVNSTPVTYIGFPSLPPSSSQTSSSKAPTLLPGELSFPRLSLMGVKQRFDKKACVFLDARKPEEYEEGHIPGALNFYGNEPEKFAPVVMPQLLDKTKEIITYCHGGDCDLSLQVAKALRDAGYTRVEIFTGGWPDWKKAGYPVTQGAQP